MWKIKEIKGVTYSGKRIPIAIPPCFADWQHQTVKKVKYELEKVLCTNPDGPDPITNIELRTEYLD